MANVLVTALGSVAGDIVIKSLKRLGHRVIGSDVNPRWCIPDAYNVDVFYDGVYSTDVEAYLSWVEDICAKEHIDFIFPMTDVEVDVFNANRKRVAKMGAVPCISPKAALDIARNKEKLPKFVNEHCPEITTIETCPLAEYTEGQYDYPLILKPYDGRSSIGLYRIYDKDAWDSALAVIKDSERYIVQPLVKGSVVVTELCRSPKTGTCVVVCREELLATQHQCGLSVMMFHDEALEAQVRHLADELGICGSVNFEWIKDECGAYHFMECNSRFSAGAEFTVMEGYDLVANHLRCFENPEQDIDGFEFKQRMVISRKYEEFITKVFED